MTRLDRPREESLFIASTDRPERQTMQQMEEKTQGKLVNADTQEEVETDGEG